MPPRTGQLDEISQAIGQLTGTVEAIEKYVHEARHDGNNLSQKIDALGTRITRDIAAVEARIEIRITAMDNRVAALEASSQQQSGARGAVALILKSPVAGWALLMVAFIVAAVKGWIKP